MASQSDMFGAPALKLPEGLAYERDFLDADEELDLLAVMESLPFAPMKYQNYIALREVVSYGGKYDFTRRQLNEADPMPDWLQPLREKAARWLGVEPEDFTQALLSQYKPGTPLGWHRDVPDFDDIVGISLLNDAVMRFRRYPPLEPKKADVIKLVLEPRSVYALRGAARWGWQHSVAPTKQLRYSVTFRTARRTA